MKRIIISFFIIVFIALAFSGCSASRKNYHELKGLMLLDDLQLKRNRAFYSTHNKKIRNSAFKKSRKNSRNYNVRRDN